MFAQQKCTLPQGKHKIIILDEADSMTEGAQQVFFCEKKVAKNFFELKIRKKSFSYFQYFYEIFFVK